MKKFRNQKRSKPDRQLLEKATATENKGEKVLAAGNWTIRKETSVRDRKNGSTALHPIFSNCRKAKTVKGWKSQLNKIMLPISPTASAPPAP